MFGADAKFVVLWSLVILAALVLIRPSRKVAILVLSLGAIALLGWGLSVVINH